MTTETEKKQQLYDNQDNGKRIDKMINGTEQTTKKLTT